MRFTRRAGVVTVLLSVGGGTILRVAATRGHLPLPPDRLAAGLGVAILREPAVQVLAFAGVLLLPAALVAGFLDARLGSAGPPGDTTRGGTRRPTDRYWKGAIRQYGVVWPATYGIDPEAGERKPFPAVREPFCADCHTNVAPHTVRRWLVLRRHVWRCPSCEATYDRPSDVRPGEREAVAERCDTELWAALRGDGREYLEDLADFHTIEWDPPAERPPGL